MRVMSALCVFSALGTLVVTASARQEHQTSLNHRGAMVMGFDQQLTTHRFLLFNDGGAIDVSVKTASDTKNREAIRSHLPHIASMFGMGNFDAPMLIHDSGNVPGMKVMAARKEAIRYRYVETPRGGRVDIVTTDTEALAAVHAFLKFQIADHKTGGSTTVRTR
jgi:hypothetical protein